MPNLKIGVDVRHLDTEHVTGVDSYLRQLLVSWLKDSRGHQLVMFGTPRLEQDELIKNLVAAGHRFVPQPLPNKPFNFANRFFNWPKIDQIIGGVDVFFLPNTMFHAFSPDVKTVMTFHDLSFERVSSLYSWKTRLWHKIVHPKGEAQRAAKIIAVSESTAKELQSLYQIPAEKIKVVPLGVDHARFSTPLAKPDWLPERYILFLGSIEPRKNAAALIRAFKSLAGQFPDLHLVLAGSFFPEPDQQAKHEFSEGRVKFLGKVSEEDKIKLYQHAEVLVLPSYYEGFGLQILEAQAAGTPVIATVNTSLPEVSGGAAILINPFNISELEQTLRQVLSDEKIRVHLREAGQRNAQKYSWSKTAQETLLALEEITKIG